MQARRARLILLVADGKSITYAAHLVETARGSAYRWLRSWTKEGVDGIRDLSPDERRQLSLPLVMH